MSTVQDVPARGPRKTPALFARLVDDAALFPPAPATMTDAVGRHLSARGDTHGGVLGFLLCPVSRLGELIAELRKAPPARPVALSLVVDTGLGGLPKAVSTAQDNDGLLDIRLVEVPAPSDVDPTWLVQLAEFVPDDVVRVVEPRRGRPDWLDGVRKVAEAGCWPKLRCGGLSTESFPSIDEVADFLDVATGTGSSFKATAGLAHAVRQHDEATGLTHHGLVNMLVATSRAVVGGDDVGRAVRDALSSTDADTLVSEVRGLGELEARAVREVFACYGSATLAGPVTDLERLGLL